jgi:hypothetical protein
LVGAAVGLTGGTLGDPLLEPPPPPHPARTASDTASSSGRAEIKRSCTQELLSGANARRRNYGTWSQSRGPEVTQAARTGPRSYGAGLLAQGAIRRESERMGSWEAKREAASSMPPPSSCRTRRYFVTRRTADVYPAGAPCVFGQLPAGAGGRGLVVIVV